MDRGDIAEVLFSCIREDDPYRASKLLQIERWCYVNWHLHQRGGKKQHNFIAQVLSDEECWEKVNNLHGVKLNRQMVGKKLILPPDSDNPFTDAKRYKIACECCLEEDVRALFEERKEELLSQGKSSLLEYEHLIGCFGEGALGEFWSHFVGGYTSRLNLKGRHIYEYGLDCAIDCRQVQAVEFFWNKIKSLPGDEMSAQKKDEVLMKNAVYAVGGNFRIYPDIFEFFFNQINPNRYPELLKRDLEKNRHYGSLNIMVDMLNFDKFQKLFDCLRPSDISEGCYHTRLYSIEIQNYSGHYVGAAEKLFLHIWTKEGFDSHRALVINEEVMDESALFHKNLLVRWVEKGCMEAVWAVLDKLDSDQIKEFMTYKQADYIRSILEQRDDNSLNRFLVYDKSVGKDLNQENMPGPGGDLSEMKFRRVHGQSNLGLGK
ncbi:hypothetical protein [Candidatus Mesenet endosymbiont of Agriotes lineatus]|uniref:hypothetical protein n=1 Tax=Candidatus Mesenet endosymbiont of Agriotes lineatus TaxID=3077948 RepID=UPI0030D3DC1B